MDGVLERTGYREHLVLGDGYEEALANNEALHRLRDPIAAVGVSNIFGLGECERTYAGMLHDGMRVLSDLVNWMTAGVSAAGATDERDVGEYGRRVGRDLDQRNHLRGNVFCHFVGEISTQWG